MPNCGVAQPCPTAGARAAPGSARLPGPASVLPRSWFSPLPRDQLQLREVLREDFTVKQVGKSCAEKGVFSKVSGAAG